MGLSMPGTLGADFDISCEALKTSFFPCFSLSSLILAAVSLPLASVAEPVVTLPPEETFFHAATFSLDSSSLDFDLTTPLVRRAMDFNLSPTVSFL